MKRVGAKWKHSGLIAMMAALSLSCGSDDSDDSSGGDSATNQGSGEVPGTLALAFPADLTVGSAMTGDSSSGSLALAEIGTYDEPRSVAEKEKAVEDIFEATEIGSCFKMDIGSFPQPACFAPNVTKSEIDGSAGDANPFIIGYDNDFEKLLYGDGGIVKVKESSGESCTAATVNYFTEDAVQYIEQGKQLFASLVCVSKFAEVTLPEVDQTTDYASALESVNLPDGASFTKATISREQSSDGLDVYTTQIGLSFTQDSKDRKIYAYFRHQPESDSNDLSKGHMVVMNAGVPDSLQEANQLWLQNEPPPPGDGGAKIAVVSVSYEQNGTQQNVLLDRGNFTSYSSDTADTKHPALFVDANGAFEYADIAEIATDNSFADNFVNTRFVNDPEADTVGKGIVGWTASLSDSFWRSFTYEVTKASDGTETAKSTFGFSPSYSAPGDPVKLPAAGKGMFCHWAQQGSSPNPDETYLDPAGPSGPATNSVQYQVSTRAADGSYFTHSETDSKLKFQVSEDCGTGTDNDLATIDSTGSIDGVFTVPTVDDFTPLGGVSLDASAIDLLLQ
jgi:hypothetical protein